MNIMEQGSEITKIPCCLSCLYKASDRNLQYYKLRSETLKTIFQIEELYLCYLCKRMLRNVELFIQTVLKNQILLESLKNVSDEKWEVKTQSICSLTKVSLGVIELTGNALQTTESIFVFKHKDYEGNDCEIKVEIKDEENSCLEDNENSCTEEIDTVDDNKYTKLDNKECLNNLLQIEVDTTGLAKKDVIKNKVGKTCKRNQIDSFDDSKHTKIDNKECLKNVIQIEVDSPGLGTECHEKDVVKKKVKKNCKRKPIDTNKMQWFYITRAQCLEELATKATEKKFLNSTYKCMDCVKGFTFKPSYDKHLELHSKENGVYVCDICKQRMDSEYKLVRHKKYHEERYRCSECGLVRISKAAISDHYMVYHANDAEPHACPECSKTFKRHLSLKKHVSCVHNNKGRVTCAYCMKTYANKDVLKMHIIMRHAAEVSATEIRKKWVCEECGKAFKAPSLLKIHSSKHSLERRYYCVECNKNFKTELGLKQHLQQTTAHVRSDDFPFVCLRCEKRFVTKRNLERHMNQIHLNIKPHMCDQCDKGYLNNWALKHHKQLAHEGYKRPLKYPCPMCDKVFNCNSILKNHIRTHTGDRPFECSKCPAKFSQSGILRTHVNLVHLKQTRDGKSKQSSKKVKKNMENRNNAAKKIKQKQA